MTHRYNPNRDRRSGRFAEGSKSEADVSITEVNQGDENLDFSKMDAKEMIERLRDGVKKLVTGDDWKRYLDIQSKFHNYSFNNTMLIMIQRPTSTTVAGYKKWQEMGRQVRTGERGISILAPITKKITETKEDGTVTERNRLVGFRGVKVFDISQTEGDPLPEVSHRLEGEAPQEMIDDLFEHADRIGAKIEYRSGDEDSTLGRTQANGYAKLLDEEKEHRYLIVVREGLSSAQAAKTLAHEIGHVALGHLDPKDEKHGQNVSTEGHRLRSDLEMEAESFAYLVSGSYNLNSSGYSFGYTAGWSGGDPDRVVASAERILNNVKPFFKSNRDKNREFDKRPGNAVA